MAIKSSSVRKKSQTLAWQRFTSSTKKVTEQHLRWSSSFAMVVTAVTAAAAATPVIMVVMVVEAAITAADVMVVMAAMEAAAAVVAVDGGAAAAAAEAVGACGWAVCAFADKKRLALPCVLSPCW